MAMLLEKTLTAHLTVLLPALLEFALLQTERSDIGEASVACSSVATTMIIRASRGIFGKVLSCHVSRCLVKLSLSAPDIPFGISKVKGGSLVSPDSRH